MWHAALGNYSLRLMIPGLNLTIPAVIQVLNVSALKTKEIELGIIDESSSDRDNSEMIFNSGLSTVKTFS